FFSLHSEQIARIKPLLALTCAANRNLPDRGPQVSLRELCNEVFDALFLCVHPGVPWIDRRRRPMRAATPEQKAYHLPRCGLWRDHSLRHSHSSPVRSRNFNPYEVIKISPRFDPGTLPEKGAWEASPRYEVSREVPG